MAIETRSVSYVVFTQQFETFQMRLRRHEGGLCRPWLRRHESRHQLVLLLDQSSLLGHDDGDDLAPGAPETSWGRRSALIPGEVVSRLDDAAGGAAANDLR